VVVTVTMSPAPRIACSAESVTGDRCGERPGPLAFAVVDADLAQLRESGREHLEVAAGEGAGPDQRKSLHGRHGEQLDCGADDLDPGGRIDLRGHGEAAQRLAVVLPAEVGLGGQDRLAATVRRKRRCHRADDVDVVERGRDVASGQVEERVDPHAATATATAAISSTGPRSAGPSRTPLRASQRSE
jgi:hypothetical protein